MLLRTLAVLLTLLSGVASAQYEPVHPTGRQVSWQWQGQIRWYLLPNGTWRQASQTELDMMVQTRLAYMAKIARYARTVPACASTLTGIPGWLAEIETRFNCCGAYDDTCGCGCPKPTGCLDDWGITPSGESAFNLYKRPHETQQRASYCSTVNDANAIACAKSKEMTPDFADYLNVRVVNGKCVPKTMTDWLAEGVQPLPPLSAYNVQGPGANMVGKADARVKCPAFLDATDLALLEATHHAHHQHTLFLCGLGPDTTVSVLNAHKAYEARACKPGMTSAQCETERHCRHMKTFFGDWDSVANGNPKGWTPAQVCHIAKLQDREHEFWMTAQKPGNWGCSRRREFSHQATHIWAGLANPFKTRMPCRGCGDGINPNGKIEDCYTYTAVEYLKLPVAVVP